MADYINHLLFGIYPYIALAVLAIGSIIRFDREPYSWRASSSQLLRRKQLIWGSVLFHLGVLVVFFGHLFGLLVPIWVFDSLQVKHEWKQTLAVFAAASRGIRFPRRHLAAAPPPVRCPHPGQFHLCRYRHSGAAVASAANRADDHSDFTGPSGRQGNGQVHGLGQWHLHVRPGGFVLSGRVQPDLITDCP